MAWTCSAAQAGQVTELYMMRLKCSRFDARNYPLLGKGSGLLMSSSSTSRWPSSCADLSPPGRPVRYMSALAALALPRTRGRTRTDDDSGAFITPCRPTGPEFDPPTGKPTAWNQPEPVTVIWYEHAACRLTSTDE